jgi:hypothetical protein
MKTLKLKDLLKEMEMPNFPTEKGSNELWGASLMDSMLQDLTPEQKMDIGAINSVLDKYFKGVKQERGNLKYAVRDAMEAFKWNDLDAGLVSEFLDDEAGAARNPNDGDQDY